MGVAEGREEIEVSNRYRRDTKNTSQQMRRLLPQIHVHDDTPPTPRQPVKQEKIPGLGTSAKRKIPWEVVCAARALHAEGVRACDIAELFDIGEEYLGYILRGERRVFL